MTESNNPSKINQIIIINDDPINEADISNIDFKKCYVCKHYMLPKNFDSTRITKEMKHRFIDLLGDIPDKRESEWEDDTGVMCIICLKEWQHEW